MGRLSILECVFWGFLLLLALLHPFPLLHLLRVTKRRNGQGGESEGSGGAAPQTGFVLKRQVLLRLFVTCRGPVMSQRNQNNVGRLFISYIFLIWVGYVSTQK